MNTRLATLENLYQFLYNVKGPSELEIKVNENNLQALNTFWENVAREKRVVAKNGLLMDKQNDYSRKYRMLKRSK